MTQIHGKTILSMEFKSIIKAHDLKPWQFIYSKPNSHWQYQNPILIDNINTQFLLAISKSNSHWQHQKLNYHWQYQKPNLCWHYLSKTQGYQYLAKYYIIIISPKSPIMNNTLDS